MALVVSAPISSKNKSSALEGKEYKNLTSAGNQGRILIGLFSFYAVTDQKIFFRFMLLKPGSSSKKLWWVYWRF